MSLLGFRAQNHPQQDARDDVDDRGTTPDLFLPLDARFGGFTLDVAAAPHNTKCARYFTREQDGLTQNWGGGSRLVQPAVLRDRAVAAESLDGRHRRGLPTRRHAAPREPHRAVLVAGPRGALP